MRGIDWTSLIIAVLALVGTLYTGYRASGRKDRATIHVERADKVVELQAEELERLVNELTKARQDLEKAREAEMTMQGEINELRSALETMSGRMTRLEDEVRRRGGDPALV